MIYDKKINLGLRNYISFTNRFYKINKIGDENVLVVMNNIHERVFKAILRLSTAKESEVILIFIVPNVSDKLLC